MYCICYSVVAVLPYIQLLYLLLCTGSCNNFLVLWLATYSIPPAVLIGGSWNKVLVRTDCNILLLRPSSSDLHSIQMVSIIASQHSERATASETTVIQGKVIKDVAPQA